MLASRFCDSHVILVRRESLQAAVSGLERGMSRKYSPVLYVEA